MKYDAALNLLLIAGVCARLWKLDGRPMDWPVKVGILMIAANVLRVASAAMEGAVR